MSPYTVKAYARANTSVTPGSARLNSPQLPVDATLGGIVPVTPRGVRLSMQSEQQPPDIAVYKLHPFLSSSPIASRQAWNTQKTTQTPLPGTCEAAEVFAEVQLPCGSEEARGSKKGKKGVEMKET